MKHYVPELCINVVYLQLLNNVLWKTLFINVDACIKSYIQIICVNQDYNNIQ